MTPAATTWRELRATTTRALEEAGVGPAEAEARFMVEQRVGILRLGMARDRRVETPRAG